MLLSPALSLSRGVLEAGLRRIGLLTFKPPESHPPSFSRAVRRKQGVVFVPRDFQLV